MNTGAQGRLQERIRIGPEHLNNKFKIRLVEEGFKYLDPVIDLHTHVFPGNEWQLLEAMDRYGIHQLVLLSAVLVEQGRIPPAGTTALPQSLYPDRFDFFVHHYPQGIAEPGYGRREAERLRGDSPKGASSF